MSLPYNTVDLLTWPWLKRIICNTVGLGQCRTLQQGTRPMSTLSFQKCQQSVLSFKKYQQTAVPLHKCQQSALSCLFKSLKRKSAVCLHALLK